MNKIFTLFFLLLLTQATAHEDEIVVKLDSDVVLTPLYLGKLIDDASGFDKSYLNSLEEVLKFDLSYNGMTFLVKADNSKSATIEFFEKLASQNPWKSLNPYYVVLAKVREKKISTRVRIEHTNAIKEIENLPLSGNIKEDRKKIHQIADTIFKALFGKDGVAATRILYTVKMKSHEPNKWISDIWEADYDGGNPVKITHGNGYCVTPVYVPPSVGYTSGGFFYVSYMNGQPKIFYTSLKEGVGRRFCYLRGNQLMPALSRQRDQVAFISDVTGNPDLFLQSFSIETGVQEKPRQIFAARHAVQGTPSFSPNGKQIAFVSNKDGAPRIYVMDIPKSGTPLKEIKPKLISKLSKESTAPSWSPDGTKLAYCATSGNVRQIWIYEFENGKERQLTQGPGNKENPTWAPDSLHLIFNSTDAHESELFLINLNQPQTKRITTGPGEKHYPNWEPRA